MAKIFLLCLIGLSVFCYISAKEACLPYNPGVDDQDHPCSEAMSTVTLSGTIYCCNGGGLPNGHVVEENESVIVNCTCYDEDEEKPKNTLSWDLLCKQNPVFCS